MNHPSGTIEQRQCCVRTSRYEKQLREGDLQLHDNIVAQLNHRIRSLGEEFFSLNGTCAVLEKRLTVEKEKEAKLLDELRQMATSSNNKTKYVHYNLRINRSTNEKGKIEMW